MHSKSYNLYIRPKKIFIDLYELLQDKKDFAFSFIICVLNHHIPSSNHCEDKGVPALDRAERGYSRVLASLNWSTSCKTLSAAMLIINEADSACCLRSEPNIMTWVFISFKINSLNEESASSLWETGLLAQRTDGQPRSTKGTWSPSQTWSNCWHAGLAF